MTELDRAFELILEWKARRLLYADYQATIGAATFDRSFKIGAIDAMVYDLASLVGFNRKTADHANWTSYGVRKLFLDRLRNMAQETPKPEGQNIMKVLHEFVADIEATGTEATRRDWPDLLVTYEHAKAALAKPQVEVVVTVVGGTVQDVWAFADEKLALAKRREQEKEYEIVRDDEGRVVGNAGDEGYIDVKHYELVLDDSSGVTEG